jgi:chitinase
MKRFRTAAVTAAMALLATIPVAAGTSAQASDDARTGALRAAATCTAGPWSASTTYTNGMTVSHEGRTWEAKWWTLGETPGTTGEWGVWRDLGACTPGEPDPDPDPDPTDPAPDPTTPPTDPGTPGEAGERVVGYFTNWGTYGRDYQVKDIETSGSADELTHILYAFGNVQNGRCTIGDSYADYDKAFTADQSVDGVADTWDQDLRGNFNQLRKLKELHPDLKVIWSFGGWTWSGGFGAASRDAAAFASSCHDLVEDPRWADVFDGIDIDWEYPNACGLTCDTSGPDAFPTLMSALRAEFGDDALVTAAITADGTPGGKIEAGGYGAAEPYVDWYMPMTYDFFGAFAAQGPTAPHSPLTSYPGIPTQGFDSSTAIAKLKALGVPSDKLLLGIGFYGRGWTGVTQAAPGGSATGAAPGTYEAGIEDYKVLKTRCPATGTVGGTAYAKCGDEWWGYDTPATIAGKMDYAQQQGLGGAFFWELSGDTTDGELIRSIGDGLD